MFKTPQGKKVATILHCSDCGTVEEEGGKGVREGGCSSCRIPRCFSVRSAMREEGGKGKGKKRWSTPRPLPRQQSASRLPLPCLGLKVLFIYIENDDQTYLRGIHRQSRNADVSHHFRHFNFFPFAPRILSFRRSMPIYSEQLLQHFRIRYLQRIPYLTDGPKLNLNLNLYPSLAPYHYRAKQTTNLPPWTPRSEFC